MKPSTAILALFLGSITISQAGLFEFDVIFDSGPLAGTSYTGQIRTTAGDGLKSNEDGSLLSLDLTIAGIHFREIHDVDYWDGGPYARVKEGALVSLQYFGDTHWFSLPIGYVMIGGGTVEAGFANLPGLNEGRVSYHSAAVPDAPSSALLLGLGWGGLALCHRHCRERARNPV